MNHKQYRFTLVDRIRITEMLACNTPQWRIAERIGCSPSAISQELNRNRKPNGDYCYEYAEYQARNRRQIRFKTTLKDPEVINFVIEQLKVFKRSPSQIASLAKAKNIQVSKSSVYNFINQNPDYKRYRRHRRYRRGKANSRTVIKERVGLTERPLEATKRLEYGHFELDFIIGKKRSGQILVARDRKTRYCKLMKINSKTSSETQLMIETHLIPLGIKTVSTDNDTAFVCHRYLRDIYGIQFYFADPGCPEQKGSVEQLNKVLRHYIPKAVGFDTLAQDEVQWIEETINNTPMPVLKGLTPVQARQQELDSS